MRSYEETAAESFGKGTPSFSWPVFFHCIGFGASLFAVVLALYEYQYGTLSILVEMCEEKWASFGLQNKASSKSTNSRCAAKASKDTPGAGTSAALMSQNKARCISTDLQSPAPQPSKDSTIMELDLHHNALQIRRSPKQKRKQGKSGSELVKVENERSRAGSSLNQFAASPRAQSLSIGTLETQGFQEDVCSSSDVPEIIDLSHAQTSVRPHCEPSDAAKCCASLAATAAGSDPYRKSVSMGFEESSLTDSVDVTDHGVDSVNESINGRVATTLKDESVHVQKYDLFVVGPPPGLEPLCEPPPGLERLGPMCDAGLAAFVEAPLEKARETGLAPVPGDLDALSTDELIALLRQEGVLDGLDQRGVPVRAHLLRCLRLLSKPPATKTRNGATADKNTMEFRGVHDDGYQRSRLRADAPVFTPSQLGVPHTSAILPVDGSEFLDDSHQPMLVANGPASHSLHPGLDADSMPVIPNAPCLWDVDACMHMEALTLACWYAVHAFAGADPDAGIEAHVRRVVNRRKTRRRARSTSPSSRFENSKVGSWLAPERWPTLEAARQTRRQASK